MSMGDYIIQYLETVLIESEGCGRYTSRVFRELRDEYEIEA